MLSCHYESIKVSWCKNWDSRWWRSGFPAQTMQTMLLIVSPLILVWVTFCDSMTMKFFKRTFSCCDPFPTPWHHLSQMSFSSKRCSKFWAIFLENQPAQSQQSWSLILSVQQSYKLLFNSILALSLFCHFLLWDRLHVQYSITGIIYEN